MILSIDVETYSPVSIGDAGAHKYVESPEFEIILFGYSVDFGEVKVIDLASGETIPPEIFDMIYDPSVVKTAYNAAFERTAIGSYIGLPCDPKQWSCSMVLAASCGLPLKLESCCAALGLPPDEAKLDGSRLIRYFCQPCAPTLANRGRTRNLPEHAPDKWARFKEYNKRDVEVENTIRKKLQRFAPNETEQKFWVLDQKINDRGVRLDKQLITEAIDMSERYNEELADRVAQLGISNIKSTQQVKDWLKKTEGKDFESLNKKAIAGVKASLSTEEAKELLELRTQLTKTSVAKFDKMLDCMCKDEHARGLFQFYGAARTGRFSGRLIQLQNLPQNHLADIASVRSLVKAGSYDKLKEQLPNISSTLSELIRTAIVPEIGCRFIVADFSAIEARVIAWYAHEDEDLAEFRGAGKIYERTASRMFNVPYERIVKGNPEYELRPKGKVATLACGYGGGVNAMIAMGALNSGIAESELPTLVEQWRSAHKNIVRWWHSLESAAKQCIRTKASATDSLGKVRFDYEGGCMWMALPSERRIAYPQPRLGENRFGNESIIYMGQNQQTKQWVELETFGGKLAENCVQATARDCLREAMMRLDDAGFDIRMHVHDEVIINEPINGRGLDEVIRLMCVSPTWAPDLPLNAAGFTTDFYMKD